MASFMEFEKPIAELEAGLKDLRESSKDSAVDITPELRRMQGKVDRLLKETYAGLTPWQKTQVARHPERPHFGDIVRRLVDGFTALAGDRAFGEDAAVVGGMGRFRGRSVMVIGQEKGADTTSRIRHNFGMARPEGYRKAIRLMALADRFGLPVITLVDTAGAYPGIEAEERGQAEAIARATEQCLAVGVPFVSAIVGEGGSGGAVALATGNRILMLEHAVYSVISPEGCASILWRTSDRAADAADALKLTAQDMKRLGVADHIVAEPLGGAHRDPERAIDALGDAIAAELDAMDGMSRDELRKARRGKYLALTRAH